MRRKMSVMLLAAVLMVLPGALSAQTDKKKTEATKTEATKTEKTTSKDTKAETTKTTKATTKDTKAEAETKAEKVETKPEKVVEAKADTAKNDTNKVSLLDKLKANIQEKIDSLKPKAEEAMIKADSVLSVRNAKITTDTFYVARPRETWTFRAKTDVFGDMMHIRAVDADGNVGSYYLNADPKVTLGIMANYRGISASFSLSPSKILSDLSDMMSAINYYNNTFGFDLTFEKVESFHGNTARDEHSHRLWDTNMRLFSATGYYVFNGKRFSLPAVFNSTWIQRRSAGSFLVQASFNTGRIKIGDNLDPDHDFASSLNRIDMNSFSLGAGYGYNLVAGKHWLIHATAQPSIMIWQNYKLHTTDPRGNEEVNKMNNGALNFFIVGRLGAIYSWDRYFIGVTSVVQHSKNGKNSDFALRDTQWQARAFFGWRLQTKLHERPQPKPRHRRGTRRTTTTRRPVTTRAIQQTPTKPAATQTKKPAAKKTTTTTGQKASTGIKQAIENAKKTAGNQGNTQK